MSSTTSPEGDKILAMKVANIGFLLDRLGQDCHPLQFLRELTQNSIEAIQRKGKPGKIIWDVDWNTYEVQDGLQKLCLIDTGDGMSGDEMIKFINQLSSSIREQSFSGNYGVGAKVSAATQNHIGVIYLSWKNGRGSMIQLYRDKAGQYGLKQFEREDGTYTYNLPIDDDIRPEPIRKNGTAVILLGNEDDENTTAHQRAFHHPHDGSLST